MKLHSGLVLSSLLSLGLLTYACANGDTVSGSSGSGGSNPSGNTGGSSSGNTGGSNSSGNTGGSNSSGNTGGSQGSGGVRATGGATGGSNVTGSGTGGTTTTGNTGGSTGTTGTGGSTAVDCGSAFQATSGGWVTMPGAGSTCWHGYAFDFTETPNCGSTISPMDFSMCSTTCALTVTGSVAAATAANTYCGVVGLGINIGQTQGSKTAAAVTPTGTGIKVAFTESPATAAFRVQLRDDTTSTQWCYTVTGASPAMIPYSSFNTACWDGSGAAYVKQPFTSVQILIAGGAAATTYSMGVTSIAEY